MGTDRARPAAVRDPSVVVVIPWRDKGDPHRKANFDLVLDRLLDLDIGEVLVCDDGQTSGPFNRSAAYNAGRRHRPKADVYVWHEADMLVSATQLRSAIGLAAREPGLVVPFNTYAYLSETSTAQVLDGHPVTALPVDYVMNDGRSVGAVGVTSTATMQAVGQWDERFIGWGYDDRAMCQAFHIATGHDTRYCPGYGFHLYHEPGWAAGDRFYGGAENIAMDEQQATEANKRRLQRYREARTPDQIRALTR